MDRDEGNEEPSVYVYNGLDLVPDEVRHVRVDPSLTFPARAFFECRHLEVVELPEGLLQIRDRAFSNCYSLRIINIPSTVTEIGKCAFHYCEKLEVADLPIEVQRLGWHVFNNCKSLKSINIPPNIELIKEGSFKDCARVSEVLFSEGLREIGEGGFSRCTSLVSVTLPPSLREVGVQSFDGCVKLNEIHMHDDIYSIGRGAFKDCNITNFRIPPLVANVDISILGRNNGLVSLELPERRNNIKDSMMGETVLGALRNIALPSDCLVRIILSANFTSLVVAFPNADQGTISTALKTRFDELPIHKICYYQSYHDNESTLQSLKREFNELNVSGKEQDCLGMTPLHILACSTKPSIEMYRLLIDKYPETLVIEDKWGDIPLMYAIWCNAPAEVVDLLVESYKSLHPDYDFNWGGMIRTLAQRNVPLPNIQRLISTHTSSFSGQKYDMQALVIELASSDATKARLYKPYTSIGTCRYLLQLSITERLESLAVSRWSVELKNVIISLPKNVTIREASVRELYQRLATYESIKEGTSVLELALWKTKIDEGRNKRARVGEEDINYKDQCRINSGADIIIRNVLPYLLPKLWPNKCRW